MSEPTPTPTTELGRLHAEIAALRGDMAGMRRDVTVMRRQHTRAGLRHGWLGLVVTDLETNPHTQYKVHLWGVVYWLINFPLIICLFFFAPGLWLKLGIFITLVYSIYANLATDYGAMSAAMAAFGSAPLPPIPDAPDVGHLEGGQ